jgi:hypothetical protein
MNNSPDYDRRYRQEHRAEINEQQRQRYWLYRRQVKRKHFCLHCGKRLRRWSRQFTNYCDQICYRDEFRRTYCR